MAEHDMEEAIERAEEFLKERHNTMNLESSRLEGDTWYLIFDVGFLNQQLKEIRVDANSGKITGYASIDADDEDDG